jgi:hypothetical protein
LKWSEESQQVTSDYYSGRPGSGHFVTAVIDGDFLNRSFSFPIGMPPSALVEG